MTLAADLLEQAIHLAAREPRRPRQASLRRAVSAAYYSLFHLIVDGAARQLTGDVKLRLGIARAFDHAAMRAAADAVSQVSRNPKGKHWFRGYLADPVHEELVAVCATLVDLQEQRHRADYDTSSVFTRWETNVLVSSARVAHLHWHRQRSTPNARAFTLACAKLLRAR